MDEDELSIQSLRAIGEAVPALLSATADVQEMVENSAVMQLQSQNATSTQTTATAGNGRNTKNPDKVANSAAPEPKQQAETSFPLHQHQAETSFASLELLTTLQEPFNQPRHLVSK